MPHYTDTALSLLKKNELDSSKNIDKVMNLENNHLNLARALDFLLAAKILNQNTFDQLLDRNQECLLDVHGDTRALWYLIPEYLKTQQTWDEILNLCSEKRQLSHVIQGIGKFINEHKINEVEIDEITEYQSPSPR